MCACCMPGAALQYLHTICRLHGQQLLFDVSMQPESQGGSRKPGCAHQRIQDEHAWDVVAIWCLPADCWRVFRCLDLLWISSPTPILPKNQCSHGGSWAWQAMRAACLPMSLLGLCLCAGPRQHSSSSRGKWQRTTMTITARQALAGLGCQSSVFCVQAIPLSSVLDF